MKYSLRSLMVAVLVGPPLIAGAYWAGKWVVLHCQRRTDSEKFILNQFELVMLPASQAPAPDSPKP